MTEFSTAAALEVQVSDSSLRSARSSIEDELGDIEVDVTATVSDQLDAGGGAMPDGGGMMASDALETANERLSEVRDDFEANLDLNETRNDLLREILDAQQMTAQQDGGGMLNSLLQSGVGLLGGGIAVAAVLAQSLASISWAALFERAISSIAIEAGDLIMNGGQAIITAGDLIADKASVTANDLIEDAASVSHEDVIDSTVAVADLLGKSLPVVLADLAKGDLPVTAGHLVAKALPVTPLDIIDKALPLGVGAILASSPLLYLDDIIKGDFPINPADIIDAVQGETGSEQTNNQESTNQETTNQQTGNDQVVVGPNGIILDRTAGQGEGTEGPGVGTYAAVGGTAALGSVALTLGLGALDGPLPFGEIAGASLAGMLFAGSAAAKKRNGGGSDTVDIEPLPEDVRQTHSGTQPPDYDASDIQASGGGASGGGGAGGSDSSRSTPDRQEVRVQADVTNEIEAQLDFSNLRDLQDFLRNPERWIERNVDLPPQPGR